MTPEQRRRIEEMPIWANRKQIEELTRLMPERAGEIDALWEAGLLKDQADAVLKVARAWAAEHPKLATRRVGGLPLAKAWELHGQSEELLKQRERDELQPGTRLSHRASAGWREAEGRSRGDCPRQVSGCVGSLRRTQAC